MKDKKLGVFFFPTRRVLSLGAPAGGALFNPFFWLKKGSTTKIDCCKKATFILSPLLEDLVSSA